MERNFNKGKEGRGRMYSEDEVVGSNEERMVKVFHHVQCSHICHHSSKNKDYMNFGMTYFFSQILLNYNHFIM